MKQIIIRDMEEKDIPAVTEIERMSFEIPWSEYSFLNELNKSRSITKVAVLDDRVIGYICAEIISDEGHILDLAVHPYYRNMGIATSLAADIIEESKIRGCAFIFLEVRASNYIAKKMYEGFGFKVIGVRKRYYIAPEEDAIVMKLEI